MERMSASSGVFVRQQKEWGEILTGFETKNKYAVSDTSGKDLYFAAEDAGSVIVRMFLKAWRPFTIVVLDENGKEVLRIKRPFRFYFHQAEVVDSQGRSLGLIRKNFSLVRRKYSVTDSSGNELYELFGPILHPWTFKIRRDGSEEGKITKKWSGLLKESVTDADNFGVEFPPSCDVSNKALLLGAVFLIDFVYFENKNNR